jgi:hypothetical protein
MLRPAQSCLPPFLHVRTALLSALEGSLQRGFRLPALLELVVVLLEAALVPRELAVHLRVKLLHPVAGGAAEKEGERTQDRARRAAARAGAAKVRNARYR